MRKSLVGLSFVLLGVGFLFVSRTIAHRPAAEPEWSINLANIEACSCPAFCQCYFTGKPAHHHGDGEMAFCRFNNAFKVNKGHWGDEKLDGMKIWMSGDLGGDFSKPPLWVNVTFEPSATPAQREDAKAIISHIFMTIPVASIKEMPDAKIDWRADKTGASAKLDDGKAGEVQLKVQTNAAGEPVVIKNLQFWAAPRNEGIIVMPNAIETYRAGSAPFEYRGTNGFFTTIDMNSDDMKKS